MEIRIERTAPLASEPRELPAAIYNQTRALLSRAPGAVFVPIRSMQFLAVVDAEEIVFVDHLHKHLAVLAWREFDPRSRCALDAAVPYLSVYYREDGGVLMSRLQGEFARALAALAEKSAPAGPGQVLPFARRVDADRR